MGYDQQMIQKTVSRVEVGELGTVQGDPWFILAVLLILVVGAVVGIIAWKRPEVLKRSWRKMSPGKKK